MEKLPNQKTAQLKSSRKKLKRDLISISQIMGREKSSDKIKYKETFKFSKIFQKMWNLDNLELDRLLRVREWISRQNEKPWQYL